jgi:hypothetical protein
MNPSSNFFILPLIPLIVMPLSAESLIPASFFSYSGKSVGQSTAPAMPMPSVPADSSRFSADSNAVASAAAHSEN